MPQAATGENTARMAVALQDVYGFSAQHVEFFTFFGTPIPGFEDAAIEVIAAGLEKGAEPRDIARVQASVLGYGGRSSLSSPGR